MRTVFPRCVWPGLIAAMLVLSSASLSASSLPPPVLARSIYVVRPDPRLCPSPLCGGYWVSLANHARTRCHDGLLRPRCYVASVSTSWTRQQLKRSLPANSLVRAVLGSANVGGFGELGVLVIAEIWEPATQAPATGDFFRVRDLGVRCIRAPCFSLRVWRLNRSFRITVSGLDLGPAKLSSGQVAQAQVALTTADGLVAGGRIVPTAEGGRVLRASPVYFRVVTPRA